MRNGLLIDRVAVGLQLRTMRESFRLDNVDFSKKIHSSTSHLSRIERGHLYPTIAWLENFADGCGFSMHDLVVYLMDPVVAMLSDKFLAEIASLVRQLKPRDREIVIEVLQDLRDRK
jgi:hypothetical protein